MQLELQNLDSKEMFKVKFMLAIYSDFGIGITFEVEKSLIFNFTTGFSIGKKALKLLKSFKCDLFGGK